MCDSTHTSGDRFCLLESSFVSLGDGPLPRDTENNGASGLGHCFVLSNTNLLGHEYLASASISTDEPKLPKALTIDQRLRQVSSGLQVFSSGRHPVGRSHHPRTLSAQNGMSSSPACALP